MGQHKDVLIIPKSANFTVSANGDTTNAQLMATGLGINTTPDGLPWTSGLATFGQDSLLVLCTVQSITAGSIAFAVDTLGSDGVWYQLATSLTITVAFPAAASQYVFTLAGQNSQSQEFGSKCRLRWVVAGGATVNFSASIIGK